MNFSNVSFSIFGEHAVSTSQWICKNSRYMQRRVGKQEVLEFKLFLL